MRAASEVGRSVAMEKNTIALLKKSKIATWILARRDSAAWVALFSAMRSNFSSVEGGSP